MADDPETTETEETTEAPEVAAEETAAVEQPVDAPVEETPAEEAPAAPAAEEPAAPAEPEVLATPKERKQARRAAAVAKRGPRRARTQEERDAERKRKADQRRRYRARAKAKAAEQPKREAPEPAPRAEGQQKVRTGIVVSDKADKTITVRIDVARRHRRYQKTIRSSSTLHVHDERNEANAGDTVRVIEARPLSRLKRWRLVEILERAR
jgi:small subunit ribosomal protein S17